VTRISKRSRISGLLAGCLAVAALLATASAASAKTYHPTRTDDPRPNGCRKQDCSLREAVIASNDSPAKTSSAIVLRPGKRYMLTRRGLGENAAKTGDLDLKAGHLTVKTKMGRRGAEPAVIDGNDIDRIFEWRYPARGLRLERIVARDGHTRKASGLYDGGAVSGSGGTLRLKNSRLVSNVAAGDGGAIFIAGGAIYISNTLLKGNAAGGDGGAVAGFPDPLRIINSRATSNSAGGNGGMASVDGVATEVRRTHLSGNRAAGAGGAIFSATNYDSKTLIYQSIVAGNESGAYGGGLAINGAVYNSTVSGNRAASSGGGIHTGYRGLTVVSSTIANNRAGGDGGGIGVGPFGVGGGAGEAPGPSTTELNGVTVARNVADSDSAGGGLGGGLYQSGGDVISDQGGAGVISVRNTIVALNVLGAGASGRDCFNASAGFDSLGHNLIGDATGCTGFDAAGDLIGGRLKLGKLAGNGGPTKTVALGPGSRAINGADSKAPPKDQRGVKRRKKSDIGAYERVAKK
jgi:hypothetical protein